MLSKNLKSPVPEQGVPIGEVEDPCTCCNLVFHAKVSWAQGELRALNIPSTRPNQAEQDFGVCYNCILIVRNTMEYYFGH